MSERELNRQIKEQIQYPVKCYCCNKTILSENDCYINYAPFVNQNIDELQSKTYLISRGFIYTYQCFKCSYVRAGIKKDSKKYFDPFTWAITLFFLIGIILVVYWHNEIELGTFSPIVFFLVNIGVPVASVPFILSVQKVHIRCVMALYGLTYFNSNKVYSDVPRTVSSSKMTEFINLIVRVFIKKEYSVENKYHEIRQKRGNEFIAGDYMF